MPRRLPQRLFVGLLLLTTAPAAAQQPAAPPRLPPVVVEGARVAPPRTATEEEAREEIQRVPGSVDLIGQDRIEESRAANLKDVLDFTPGVLIRPRAGAADESQISIRGSGLRNNFHLRGVNVLIDGFPYGNADGFSDFEALELLVTRRIEVYKGANALRFGGNTLGGAINLVTRTGHDAGPLELRGEAGSFGFSKFYLGSGWVVDPFDVYAGLTSTELDGYREHSEQLRRRAYATAGYRLAGGTTLRLDLNFARVEERLPGALTEEEFERDPRRADPSNVTGRRLKAARDYDYTRAAFTLRTPLTESQVLEWGTQVNYQDLHHPLPFAVIDDTTYSYSTELRWIATTPLLGRPSRFTAGLQYFGTRQTDANLSNVAGLPETTVKDQQNLAHNVGLYAEEQLDLTSALTAVVGGRAQYATREVRDRFLVNGNQSDAVDFLAFTPRVGLIGRPTPTVQVYANASRAYEPPLLLELTAPGQLGGSLEQLEPQKAWQFEVGARGTLGDRLAWDVAVYDIELWDEIRNVKVRPFPGAFFTIPRFENIPRSRHTGVEVGLDVVILRDVASRLGLGGTGDSLSARAAYTWSRFVFVDDPTFGNNRLPGAPEHLVRAELRYDHASGVWLAPNVEAVPQGYFVNSDNTVRTKPYALAGVQLGYDYRPWNLAVVFEGRNLADTNYVSSVVVDSANQRFFEPGDGRAFYGTVQWRWK
jgi:iron complex outermembrane receptor protein